MLYLKQKQKWNVNDLKDVKILNMLKKKQCTFYTKVSDF